MSNIRKRYPNHRKPVLTSDNLKRKKLSKHNLNDLQDFLDSSLLQPDIVLKWISRTHTTSNTDDVSPVSKKRNLALSLPPVAVAS